MGRHDAVIRLAGAPVGVQARVLRSLTPPQRRELGERWSAWAHDGQLPPEGDWRLWLMMAGRGFGKTRAGAEWVSALARDPSRLLGTGACVSAAQLRIALVGATAAEVRRVMIEGESGLLAVAREGERLKWERWNGILTFASGAQAFAYSGGNPEKLRGPQHHVAWCDELAKWRYPDRSWDNLMLGLRLGEAQRVLVTTTPRPLPILRRLTGGGQMAVTRGGTADNPNLHDSFIQSMQDAYGGTRLGRQELEGELIEDVEGALWTRALIERCRTQPPADPEQWRRIVIGVDPPASAGGACGIVAAGLDWGGSGHVIGDHSVSGGSPEEWANAVAGAFDLHGADRVIAEANNGGDMVESVLRAASPYLPVRQVHASRGKAARAEPVAALFEKGKAKFAGCFPELEDELAGITVGGRYEGPGRSPDRADAMVWALSELMLGKPPREPRIVGL